MLSSVRRVLALFAFVVFVAGLSVWFLFERESKLSAAIVNHVEDVWRGDSEWNAGMTNSEILRYIEKRGYGHPLFEYLVYPLLKLVQRQFERPVPEMVLATLGKGQQAVAFGDAPDPSARRLVSDAEQLKQALLLALPGQIIEIQPGHYSFNSSLFTGHAGSASSPIVVRAAQPGQVFIEFNAEEGFKIDQPYWVFENLNIRGVCSDDQACEHAFHVVGRAKHTIIRNNRLEDFNSHVKVNGDGGDWPDDGLLSFNTLTNAQPRVVERAVTPVDLVGASRWVVADNVVSNFVRGVAGRVSYGIFMKGGGRGGRIERNLVVCTTSDISQVGLRVGISFGGGGTEKKFCRDGACEAEHSAGVVSNNVIAHCNDFGIDVLKGAQTVLAHNTLINTSGISARGEVAAVSVYGNLLEGRIRAWKGAQLKMSMNESGPVSGFMRDPDKLDLGWARRPEKIPSLPLAGKDFCGRDRADGTLPGAFGVDTC